MGWKSRGRDGSPQIGLGVSQARSMLRIRIVLADTLLLALRERGAGRHSRPFQAYQGVCAQIKECDLGDLGHVSSLTTRSV